MPDSAPADTKANFLRQGLYPNAAHIDTKDWHWPHFSPLELACKCKRHCRGEYYHNSKFLDALEKLRAEVGPIVINSAHRCKRHNAAVGGVRNSMHTKSIAADISLKGHDRKALAKAAVKAGFRGLGYGRTFLHVDLGPRRSWTYLGALPAWIRAFGYNPITGQRD